MATFNGLQVDRLTSAAQAITGAKGAGIMPALAPELTPILDLSDWADNPSEQQLGWTQCGGYMFVPAVAANRSFVALVIPQRRIVQVRSVLADESVVAADLVYLQTEVLTGSLYTFNLGASASHGPMSSSPGQTTGGCSILGSNDGLGPALTGAQQREFVRYVATDTTPVKTLLLNPFTVVTRENETAYVMVIRSTVNQPLAGAFQYRWREMEAQERW